MNYWQAKIMEAVSKEFNHRENRGSAEEAEKYVSDFQFSVCSVYPLIPLWLTSN
jgi:hypothetical protein